MVTQHTRKYICRFEICLQPILSKLSKIFYLCSCATAKITKYNYEYAHPEVSRGITSSTFLAASVILVPGPKTAVQLLVSLIR